GASCLRVAAIGVGIDAGLSYQCLAVAGIDWMNLFGESELGRAAGKHRPGRAPELLLPPNSSDSVRAGGRFGDMWDWGWHDVVRSDQFSAPRLREPDEPPGNGWDWSYRAVAFRRSVLPLLITAVA